VALAKVDVDKNRELAMRYNVRGIPAVKIFRDGSVVSEFTGALPRPEVERILQGILPTAADDLVKQGDALLEQGKTEAAMKRFQRALEEDERHAGALVRLGELALEEGDTERAVDLLSRVEEDAAEYESAQGALARIEFAETCRRAGGLAACRRRVDEAAGDDPEAHYKLGCCLAARADYEGALAEFLHVLQIDREYEEQAARKAMLRIFSLVGPQSELAQQYRRKLAAALY
jgi:putative thioredoxin